MKINSIFFCLLLLASFSLAQQRDSGTVQKRAVFISAGAHLGFWAKDGQDGIPFNLQADVLLSSKFMFGLAYSYDAYLGDPHFFSTRTRPGKTRQNMRVRACWYLNTPEKIFSTYIGLSGGLSLWEVSSGANTYPTAQFLFGMKLQLYKGIFWVHEFGAGPPYIYQSSLGYRF